MTAVGSADPTPPIPARADRLSAPVAGGASDPVTAAPPETASAISRTVAAESAGESRGAPSQPLAATGGTGGAAPAPSASPAAPASAAAGSDLARAAIPQLAGAIRGHPGRGEVEIRLDPPELGRVRIGIDIVDNGLRASLLADRAATGELLRSHGAVLIQHLQNAGFTEIDLQFGASPQGGQHRDGEGPAPGEAAPAAAGAGTGAPTRGFAPIAPSSDGIDLRL